MDTIITTLYIANSAVAFAAYLPQCWTLWRMLKTGKVNTSVSLLTWLMWSWACSVTALYAVTVNREDTAFMLISLINAVFCVITLLLTGCVHYRAHRLREKLLHEEW